MYILVYFEKRNCAYAEKAAIFFDEKSYNDCLSSLEKSCYDNNFDFITENVTDNFEDVKEFLNN